MKRYALPALAVLFVISFTYRVRDTAYRLSRLAYGSEMAAHPIDIAEPRTTIVSLRPEAEAAGILKGDVLIGVEGRPYRGASDLHVPMLRARAGDPLRLRVESRSDQGTVTRDATVELMPPRTSPPTPREYAQVLIAETLVPFLCLALGFWVAAVRIRDVQAWLLLLLMISFAEQAGGSALHMRYGVNDPFKYIAAAYPVVLSNLWPLAIMLFGLYFPERLTLDRLVPWAKWIIIAPLVFRSAQYGLLGVLQLNHADLAIHVDEFLPYPNAYTVIQMIAVGIFFAATGHKTAATSNRDARRRLFLLHAGATISLTPIFILLLIDMYMGRPRFASYPAGVFTSVLLLLALFPLTLAYVIVVERAMDVRVVVRQGVQYLLATGGIRALQLLLSAGVILFLALTSVEGATTVQRIQILALGAGGVFILQLIARRARAYIDRRFFREAYDAEQILNELAEKVRTMVETKPLLETITQRIAESLHVSRVSVLLNTGGAFRPAYAFGYPKPPEVAIPEESSTVHLLRKEGHARVYFDDAGSWVHAVPDAEKSTLQQLETQLLLPLSLNRKVLGILVLGAKRSEEPYSRSDLRLLGSVATQAGLALENSRLTSEIASEVAQRERLNREIEIAREVQERLFPQELPAVPGLDYAGLCRPASGVGGDYYDFISLPGGKLGIAIGDVSGKGIPAALLMASLRASLRGQAIQGGDNLALLMSNVNKLVYESSSSNRYATFFYAEYDARSRDLAYVNAGHNPPLVFRGREVFRLETGGPVVGLLPVFAYEQAIIRLEPGDVLVAFTDGISEAMNRADEEWGEDRLMECVLASGNLNAGELIRHTVAAADAFAAGASQHDDMTMIAARVETGAEPD